MWRRVADVNVVDRVAHGGGEVMDNEHFIDGILNAQIYLDEILRPIVVPFIHDHHLMLQHDNARPHVAMFRMLWTGIYHSVFQFLPISSNFAQPL